MSLREKARGRWSGRASRRTVEIKDAKTGEVAFRQENVEAPASWSDRAVEQPARLYFRTIDGVRESSVFAMVDRVVGAIVEAATRRDVGTPLFVAGSDDQKNFGDNLRAILLDQRGAFNTPVWINAGATEKPQCSACFIQGVDDSMESLTALQAAETMLFRNGSGTGSDFSRVRPQDWPLSRGGTASGPMSFMRGLDGWAGVTKSGGKARRAAKMNSLSVSHPDIMRFVESKVEAQRMIRALVAAGWDDDFNGVAASWVPYQNANHSVRVSDAFMRAVEAGGEWVLTFKDFKVKRPARVIWDAICRAAWECGDPGLQFDDTINHWHTTPSAGRINASNPCSEYMYLDDSACNLASMNLCKYYGDDGFVVDRFILDARTMFIAMEAIVGMAGYPTPKIAENSRHHRPLGLGYANLGAMLMRAGLPYDSDRGRAAAASVTSLLGAAAYATSAEIADKCGGPFSAYRAAEMLRVVSMHAEANAKLISGHDPAGIENIGVPAVGDFLTRDWAAVADAAGRTWDKAIDLGRRYGFRNAQATLLAPTGTIGFMMDCDTTGIEPETALIRRKHLASGGDLKLMNGSVAIALECLGYSADAIERINDYLVENETLDGCRDLLEGDRPVFHTSLGFKGWTLRPEAHVLMCAAVQPFLSGAISKTVNLPADCTAEDIGAMYQLAWRQGMKAVAVYRDGCKGSQPLTVKTEHEPIPAAGEPHARLLNVSADTVMGNAVAGALARTQPPAGPPTRRRLPAEVETLRRKIELEGHDFYFHIGLFPEGSPGEMFISSQKEGSIVKALLDQLATAVSIALQYGAPFDVFLSKMAGTRFDPSGFTGDPEFPTASSFLDAFAQWARKRFYGKKEASPDGEGVPTPADAPAPPEPKRSAPRERTLSGRLCRNGCGPMMQDGTCWRCAVCGDNTGGCGG